MRRIFRRHRTVIIGGESQEPERVLEELQREVARICSEGIDPARFERPACLSGRPAPGAGGF